MKFHLKIIEVLSISLLIITGLVLVFISSRLSGFIEPNFYPFELDISPRPENLTPILNFFRLNYDFTRKSGNLTFKMNMKDIQSFHFEIPSLNCLKKEEYQIKLLNYKGEYEVQIHNYTHNGICRNNIDIYDLKDAEDVYFMILFKSEMNPSGAFIINNPGRFRLSEDKYGIEMILGSDFICQVPCIGTSHNLEQDRLSTSGKVKFDFLEGSSEKSRDYFSFSMDGMNKKKTEKKNLCENIGISFLVSGLVLLIERFLLRIDTLRGKKPI